MSVAQAVALHRRQRGKQAAPAAYVLDVAAYQAIVDEGWHELAALDDDVRRKHVHWVHVKTNNPDHRRPQPTAAGSPLDRLRIVIGPTDNRHRLP